MKLIPLIRNPEPFEDSKNLQERVNELESKVKELEAKLNTSASE
ncbi:hypothetical protein DFO70_11776 [Cytobacillus firmus]|uniref:Uncharacterized protein n=2 Tax=Cytobacillus TaxID=2675230 RepID=A0A366JKB8_CYTFI|nr:hypothetical protein DFO70_11776 [Cytobacillus firmus]TDX39248.1 hypothetical protein DFO72_11178 [Cytobacillus oceanisediminis]